MSVLSADKDYENLSIVMVTEFEAPIEEVWELWADPRKLKRWWGPPAYPATFEEHDLSPGGEVTYYMTSPEGEKYRGWWRILAVDRPNSISFNDGFADAHGNPVDEMPVGTVEVRFEESGGTTRMELRSRYESLEDMEKIVEMGAVEGMSAAMGQMDAVLRGDVMVTRALQASPQEVFDAWTQPEKFARWFGGDDVEVPLDTVAMDLRVGGEWKATMRLSDGEEINWVGAYTEVSPPERLAFTINDTPSLPAGDPVTVDIFDAGGPTGVTVIQPRGEFSEEQVAQTAAGYNAFFDSMEKVLAT